MSRAVCLLKDAGLDRSFYRIGRDRSRSADSPELRPTERREVDVRERFALQVDTPADRVSLVALEF